MYVVCVCVCLCECTCMFVGMAVTAQYDNFLPIDRQIDALNRVRNEVLAAL